jgi:cytochrome c553
LRLKLLKSCFLIFLSSLFLISCQNSIENPLTNDAPADHTLNKSGALHKSGLNDPLNNCISCHGNDLTGGTSGVSCFSCHGRKW